MDNRDFIAMNPSMQPQEKRDPMEFLKEYAQENGISCENCAKNIHTFPNALLQEYKDYKECTVMIGKIKLDKSTHFCNEFKPKQ